MYRNGHIPWNKNKVGIKYPNRKKPKPFTEEHRKKIGEKARGRIQSLELRKRISEKLKGHIVSEETRLKISESNKNKKRPWVKGRKIGFKITEETRKKLSNIKKGKKQPWNTGERSHLWRGGITPKIRKIRNSIEFRLWREAVFARDNWTCQKCFVKGGKLNAHHIKYFAKFPEFRFAVDNGITLCYNCHTKSHLHKLKRP